MTILRSLLACLFGIAAQACSSGGSSQPVDPPDPPALVVELVEFQVTVRGMRFEDAVVTLMNRSMVRLAPSIPGGRIRVGGLATTVPRDAESEVVHESEAMDTLASSVTIHRRSASLVEVELEDVAMQSASGRRFQMDSLRTFYEEDGSIRTMDAVFIDPSNSEAGR